MPIARQVIENLNAFSESGAPAIGPSGANWSQAWQIYHHEFRPAYRMRPFSESLSVKLVMHYEDL
ncbi:MAG: hypothetical protein ACREDD_14155, partial [Methylocella sp.]